MNTYKYLHGSLCEIWVSMPIVKRMPANSLKPLLNWCQFLQHRSNMTAAANQTSVLFRTSTSSQRSILEKLKQHGSHFPFLKTKVLFFHDLVFFFVPKVFFVLFFGKCFFFLIMAKFYILF